jgi:hypothetical protein
LSKQKEQEEEALENPSTLPPLGSDKHAADPPIRDSSGGSAPEGEEDTKGPDAAAAETETHVQGGPDEYVEGDGDGDEDGDEDGYGEKLQHDGVDDAEAEGLPHLPGDDEEEEVDQFVVVEAPGPLVPLTGAANDDTGKS